MSIELQCPKPCTPAECYVLDRADMDTLSKYLQTLGVLPCPVSNRLLRAVMVCIIRPKSYTHSWRLKFSQTRLLPTESVRVTCRICQDVPQ